MSGKIQSSGDEVVSGGAPTDAEISQLVGLYNQGHCREALTEGAKLSARYPRVAALHNILGVVNARLDQFHAALEHYDQALSIRPDYAEVHNNRGNALNRLGRNSEAIESFRRALRSMPEYFAAHNNLGSALHGAGRFEEAVASYGTALKIKPDYAEAHNNLGNVLMDMGNYDEALASFSRAIQYNSGLAQAYTGLGKILNSQGLHQQAIDNMRTGLRLNPGSAAAHSDLANALSDIGRYDEAVTSFRAALKINPNFAEAHSNLGNIQTEFGHFDDAMASYNEALRLKPQFAEAHNNLSLIKEYSDDDPQVAQMLGRLAEPDITENERMYLSFALGKVYADLGDIDESFEHYSQGNRLRKLELGYDISRDQTQFEKIKSSFSGSRLPAMEGDDSEAETPKKVIFIVGMPRSGTTLTEQILASHSMVFGAGELQTAGRILSPIMRDIVATGKQEIDRELRSIKETYLGEIRDMGKDETFVTDKMPANFRWVGFLLMAMPGARIVNLQRDPAASCWSMFKLLFSGNGYTNDLTDLANYYHLYADLMNFWHQKFPNRIYDLNYESLTENQEEETRKLLEYCGLPWEARCLEFHKTKRTVRTPSGSQVRKKMYTGSSDAWRKYEAHLEPMLSILNS